MAHIDTSPLSRGEYQAGRQLPRPPFVSREGIIELFSYRNDCASRIVSAFIVGDCDDEAVQTDLQAVQSAGWELSTISSRTQRIKQLLAEEDTEPEPLDLDDVLSKLAEVDADTPCADVEFNDETNDVAVQATPTFPTAVADVVHQIATHNEEEVHVDVTVTVNDAGTDEEKIVLRIDDDANGLPELDVQAVNADEETPLNHAEGLALWCLEWTVTKSDGELHVAPEDTTLKIQLPIASTGP